MESIVSRRTQAASYLFDNMQLASTTRKCGFASLTEAIALDIETTGLNPWRDRIVAAGMIRMDFSRTSCDGLDVCNGTYNERFNPLVRIPRSATKVHGIKNEDVKDNRTFKDESGRIRDFIGNSPIIGHNVRFDKEFLSAEFRRAGLGGLQGIHSYCTMARMRELRGSRCGEWYNSSLEATARALGMSARNSRYHDPLEDAEIVSKIAIELFRIDNGMDRISDFF